MGISKSDVEHVAKLAKLSLNPQELERFQGELATIIKYVAKLNELDTSDVDPTLHGLEGPTALREDGPAKESLPKEDALRSAPESDRGYFRVPRVV